MWRMRVVHATGYAYKSPVTASFNEARLTPRSDSRQNVILNRVETTPPATRSYRYVDYWAPRSRHSTCTPPRTPSSRSSRPRWSRPSPTSCPRRRSPGRNCGPRR